MVTTTVISVAVLCCIFSHYQLIDAVLMKRFVPTQRRRFSIFATTQPEGFESKVVDHCDRNQNQEKRSNFLKSFVGLGSLLMYPGLYLTTPTKVMASNEAFQHQQQISASFSQNIIYLAAELDDAYANIAPPKVTAAIENILRVYKSLQYIEEDIENKGDPNSVISQIKVLLKNYQLKDNVIISLEIVPQQKEIRNEAKFHGTSAVEDLSQVFEYFSDEIDNMSGNKFPPRQILSFALDATKAARVELGKLFAFYPPEVFAAIDAKISKEFSAN